MERNKMPLNETKAASKTF